jgi:ankyrin repeat protein
MGIHEDAQQGTLVGDILINYLKNNPNILNEQDPTTGRAPLATAAVAGKVDVVEQLLRRGAKADALSRNNETALLLTTRLTTKDRPRIVQLLLGKTSANFVDATTEADDKNTPLMYSVRNKDLDSIRLLVNANASRTATNKSNKTAMDLAASDKAVEYALDPKEEQAKRTKLTDMVGSFLLYIVAWVNKTADNVMNRLFGLKPKLNETIDDVS